MNMIYDSVARSAPISVKQLSRSMAPKLTILSALLTISCLWAGPAFGQSPVSMSIATTSPGYLIPDDFSGLSFEIGSQRPNRNGVTGNLFSASNTQLITLFQNVGLRNLRIGGGTVDGTNATVLTHGDIDNLFAFAGAAGVKVIYSLQLENGNSATDASSALYIWQKYQAQLDCFAIGNEPDWDSYHYPPSGTGTDPAISNYPSYLSDWRNFAAAITNAEPGEVFAGPDTGAYTKATYYLSESWTQHFADDENNSGIIALVTQHFYVGASPGTNTAQQGIQAMLSPSWVTASNQWLYANNMAPVVADGLAYRLTESNDYLDGITNASDAFASALWALDYMHWWAAHNCAGVNFHNKPWLTTDTVYLDSSVQYQINPKAYGIKAFDIGGHGNVLPVTLTNSGKLNLTAYAVQNANNLNVTIVNKENGTNAHDASVTIVPNGISSASVAAMFLAASGNPGATNGVTLGGATITNNAPWTGQWTSLGILTNGQCTVTVPACSAAIVAITPIVPTPGKLSVAILRNNQLRLSWTNGTLQTATNITGPYQTVIGATPPYTTNITNTQQFYRLKGNP